MKIRCLIIDDEPLAQRIVERYIQEIPTLELVQKCDNALDAIEILKEKKIDLIFLDINMPKLTGLEFLRILKHPRWSSSQLPMPNLPSRDMNWMWWIT